MRTGQKFDYFEVSLIYDCELKNNLKKNYMNNERKTDQDKVPGT